MDPGGGRGPSRESTLEKLSEQVSFNTVLDARKLAFSCPLELTDEHSPAVHIEDFTGDKASQRSTKEENRPGNLIRGTDPSHWNRVVDLLCRYQVLERGARHVCIYPSGCHAIDINVMRGELGG